MPLGTHDRQANPPTTRDDLGPKPLQSGSRYHLGSAMPRYRDNEPWRGAANTFRDLMDQQSGAMHAMAHPHIAQSAFSLWEERERNLRELMQPARAAIEGLGFARSVTLSNLRAVTDCPEPARARHLREMTQGHARSSRIDQQLKAMTSGAALAGQQRLEELARGTSGLAATVAAGQSDFDKIGSSIADMLDRMDGGAARALEDWIDRARGITLTDWARQQSAGSALAFSNGLDELMRLGAGAESFHSALKDIGGIKEQYDEFLENLSIASLYRDVVERAIEATDDEDLEVLCQNLVTENPWRFDRKVLRGLRALFARMSPDTRVVVLALLVELIVRIPELAIQLLEAPQLEREQVVREQKAADSELATRNFRVEVRAEIEQQAQHREWEKQRAAAAERGHVCVVRNARLWSEPDNPSNRVATLRAGDVGAFLGVTDDWWHIRLLSPDGGADLEGYLHRRNARRLVAGLHPPCDGPTVASETSTGQ